jgi:hypothetical protein
MSYRPNTSLSLPKIYEILKRIHHTSSRLAHCTVSKLYSGYICLESGNRHRLSTLRLVDIVTDWAVSRKRIGEHAPISAHPTIGHPLLGNRLVNTSRSKEYATIGCPLLGNAWENTPDNNTGYPLLSNWCFLHVGPCRAYIRRRRFITEDSKAPVWRRDRIPPPWPCES